MTEAALAIGYAAVMFAAIRAAGAAHAARGRRPR
jgi:hypothetical protein